MQDSAELKGYRPAAVPTSASRRRLVLIAEPDDSVRTMLGRMLQLKGFDFIATATVDEAIDGIARHRPTAAIVELRLPGGSGRDVVVSIPPRVPVILFSAVPQESGELERLRPRTRLVTKPYSLLLLIEMLDEMLASAELLPGGS